MTKKIAIIGAGPGGLSAAMLLAHAGHDVTVYEKHSTVGGRNAEIKMGDYSFDTGPTFLHMPWILEEIFAQAGEDLHAHLDIRKLTPFNHLIYRDIDITCYSEPEKMTAEIAQKFPGSESQFQRYLEDERKLNRAIFGCLEKPFQHWWNLLRPSVLRAAPYVFSRHSVFSKLGTYFEDDRLKMAMSFQTKYLGMAPWKCPGFLSCLASWEYLYGVYHVQGGLCRISQTMADIATKKGATIRLGAEVKTCRLDGKKITAIELMDGEVCPCDEVVMNADFAYAMTHLMGERNIAREKMQKIPMSCSTYMIYLGLDTLYTDQGHHQILMADDYKQWVREIEKNQAAPDDMCVYVRNASLTDPSLAPKGHSALYILAPVPNNLSGIDWDTYKQSYREKVLDRVIERTGMTDLRSHITCEKIITPLDWESHLNVFEGATFSIKHTLNHMLVLRPHNRYERFENCYLVGGGTHPGSGIIPILQSGRISADMIAQKHGTPYTVYDFHTERL